MYVSLDSPERAFECIDRGKFAYTTYLHENLRTRRKIRTFLATWPDQSWRRSLARWKIKRERAHCTPLYPYFIPSSHFPPFSLPSSLLLLLLPPGNLVLLFILPRKNNRFEQVSFTDGWKSRKNISTVGNTVIKYRSRIRITFAGLTRVLLGFRIGEARRKARNGATRCTCQLPLHA